MNELPSIAGRTAIVTGANSPDGIGYNIAYQLLLKGAKVFIGARSLEKANSAIQLINSVSTPGTNHLGPFLFSTTLLPLLVRTAKINHDGAEEIQAGFLRYGLSKLVNVLFHKELQRPLDAQGVPILSLSVHPGVVATDGVAGFFCGRDNDMFRASISPADGALTPLFAAACPEPREMAEKYKGGLLMPWGGLKEASEAGCEENATALWKTSEKVLETLFIA